MPHDVSRGEPAKALDIEELPRHFEDVLTRCFELDAGGNVEVRDAKERSPRPWVIHLTDEAKGSSYGEGEELPGPVPRGKVVEGWGPHRVEVELDNQRDRYRIVRDQPATLFEFPDTSLEVSCRGSIICCFTVGY